MGSGLANLQLCHPLLILPAVGPADCDLGHTLGNVGNLPRWVCFGEVETRFRFAGMGAVSSSFIRILGVGPISYSGSKPWRGCGT